MPLAQMKIPRNQNNKLITNNKLNLHINMNIKITMIGQNKIYHITNFKFNATKNTSMLNSDHLVVYSNPIAK